MCFLKEQEWFASRNPDIANAAGAERKRRIAALAIEDSKLHIAFLEALRQENGWSHFIRNSERYPLCGRGRINTYAIFAETNRWILGATGRVGCIVQSGIATDDNTKFFFQDIVKSHTLASIYDFDNLAGIFPDVDSRYKFCLLTLAGPRRPVVNKTEFVFFAHTTEDIKDDGRSFTLSPKDVELINPNTLTCPIFRSKRDAELTKAIYKRVPVLCREHPIEANPWNTILQQGMFNMTSDSHLFLTRELLEADGWTLKGNAFHRNGETYQPLYEGKMIWHFDHRFSSYDGLQVDDALSETQHDNSSMLSIPRYWVHQSHLPNFMIDGRKAFLTFRDITNTTNFRTAIFSIIPLVPCGNNLPIAILPSQYICEVTFIATCTSSYIFDYVARQKLGGTHMNFFILKQLPVLPPNKYQEICRWQNRVLLGDWILPRALELTYTAWDLESFAKGCGYDSPPFRWNEERRFLLRSELDAAYFHLYGIEREDVGYILETFPIVKRKDEKQYGEYRTKRVILEMYDEMKQAMETGVTYKTRLEPPPADPSVAHAPRERVDRIYSYRSKGQFS